MKPIHLKLLILCLILGNRILGQLPENLVPNPSLELGSGTPGYKRIEGQIFDWSEAYPSDIKNAVQRLLGMEDDYSVLWWDKFSYASFYNTTEIYKVSPTYFINRFIELKKGIKVKLVSNKSLEKNKTYILRMKMKCGPNGTLPEFYNVVHFTQKSDWTSNSSNKKLEWAAISGKNLYTGLWVKNYHDFNIDIVNWFVVETIFKVPNNSDYDGNILKNLIIVPWKNSSSSSGGNILLDDIELYEYCTELVVRENRDYYLGKELEEANLIIAGETNGLKPVTLHKRDTIDEYGFVADELGVPNWYHQYWPKITYKAGEQVWLKPGFTVERSAEFHAKIAPCGKNCTSPEKYFLNEYIICGNNCIQLATNVVSRNLQITWTSQTPANLSYLSSTNILNPIFCPPNTNEIGTYEYEVEIRNECNELSKKKIRIKHFPNPTPNPIINILSSNLNTKPLYPEIKLETDEYLEYLTFDILNCQGTLVKSYQFAPQNGITPGLPFTFLMSELIDPCECYKIRIRSKNFCNENIEETILNWNQETSPKNISLSNVTVCKNGKRMLCFSAKGVRSVNFNLFNRWGTTVMNILKSYSTNPFCIQIPSNLSNGTYYYIIEFIGCDGTKQTYTSSVEILNCGEQLVGDNDSLSNSNNLTINDSLGLDVLPNPILPESKILYFIADTGIVSIKLLDRNFELVTMLQDNVHKNPGHYELPLSTANLANGLYYCLVEFNGKRFLKTYKLILKN